MTALSPKPPSFFPGPHDNCGYEHTRNQGFDNIPLLQEELEKIRQLLVEDIGERKEFQSKQEANLHKLMQMLDQARNKLDKFSITVPQPSEKALHDAQPTFNGEIDPSEVTDSSTLKQLLRDRLPDPFKVSYLLAFHACKEVIPLFAYSDGQRLFLPTEDLFEKVDLDSEEENDSDSHEEINRERQALDDYLPYYEFKQGEDQVLATQTQSRSSKDTKWTSSQLGDAFIALGYLLEQNDDGFYRTTQYVVAVNISTEPPSVWLIFDYSGRNGFGEVVKLPCPDLKSCYHHSAYDLYHNVICEGPQAECEKTLATMQEMTNRKETKGYLGSKEPWDVALLYQDIDDWLVRGKNAQLNPLPAVHGLNHSALRLTRSEVESRSGPMETIRLGVSVGRSSNRA